MPALPPDFDEQQFRSALGRFPTGVTVVTTVSPTVGPEPIGLTVSSFNSVSLRPPLILWSLARSARSYKYFRTAERYVVHVLGASQLELAKRFATGTQAERFDGLALTTAPSGTPMLADAGCSAWFECFNLTQHIAGDHIIFIGQVEHCYSNANQPLVFHAGDFELTPLSDPLPRD